MKKYYENINLINFELLILIPLLLTFIFAKYNFTNIVLINFIIIFSLLIIIEPFIGFISLLAISPFLSLPENYILSLVFKFFVFIFFITIISSLLKRLFKKDKDMFNIFFFIPLVLLFISIFISIFPAINNEINIIDWLRRFFPFSILIISFPTFWEIKDDKKRFKFLLYLIFFITLLNSFKIYYLFLSNISKVLTASLYTDIRSSWYGRNGISLITSNFLILYFILINKEKKYDKFLLFLYFLSLLSIIITFTRTYWIAIPLGYIFLYLFLDVDLKRKFRKLLLNQIVLFSIFAILTAILSPNLFGKFVSWIIDRIKAIEPSQIYPSSLSRIDEYKFLIPLILKRPLFGYGLANYYFMYSINPFTDRGLGWVLTSYSHNFYLYHIYSTGIFGLAIFLYFIIHIIYKGIKLYKSKKDTLPIIISAIFFSISISAFLFPEFNDKLTNLILGCLIGILGYFESIIYQKP